MRLTPFVLLLTTALPLAAQTDLPLIPMPREVTPGKSISLAQGLRLDCADPCDAQDAFAIADFKAVMAERHVLITDAATAPHIFVTRAGTRLGQQVYREAAAAKGHPAAIPAEWNAEGYAITPDRDGIAVTAATASGIFYALQTAKQLVSGESAPVLRLATIRDWPAMQYRGLSDDLSRGPIDTLEFQKKLIRTLAAYKDNFYSPYFENSQQYASNPLSAPVGGSVSAADARELAAYAAQYHIMVVPDQEAFGHLRHTLIYEQYAPLAETPHGAVLAPSQTGSLKVISDEFAELAELYPSPFLHVGADETDDLGLGQSKSAVEAQGLGPVYLDFMQKIDTTLRPLNRRLLFWGDIAEKSPELLKAMPASFKRDTIAISWHYNPSATGFTKYLNYFKSAGFETWVAPGINNWSRVYPNYNYGLTNIQQFTRDGQKLGATGQLNTLWNDDGEALASNNYYGILFGCAAAWQPGESSITQFQQNYAQVFHGDATGKLNEAQQELMAAHALLKSTKVGDGSDLLFWGDPWAPDYQKNVDMVRPVLHELRLHAERAMTLIAQARAAAPVAAGTGPAPYLDTDLIGTINAHPWPATGLREPDAIDAMELGARRFDFLALKFQLADEIRAGYARAVANSTSSNKKTRDMTDHEFYDINGVNGRIQDIKDGYSALRDLYAQLWLRTNRPSGLRPVLEHYDYTVGLWLARMDKMRTAQRIWNINDTVPSAATTGVPAPAPTN